MRLKCNTAVCFVHIDSVCIRCAGGNAKNKTMYGLIQKVILLDHHLWHTRSVWRCVHLYTLSVFCRFFLSFCCVWDVSEGQPFGSGMLPPSSYQWSPWPGYITLFTCRCLSVWVEGLLSWATGQDERCASAVSTQNLASKKKLETFFSISLSRLFYPHYCSLDLIEAVHIWTSTCVPSDHITSGQLYAQVWSRRVEVAFAIPSLRPHPKVARGRVWPHSFSSV